MVWFWWLMDNRCLARWLLEYAHALEAQKASLYRVRAYRRAAQTLLALDRPAAQIVEAQGRKGLEELPGIGTGLSSTIAELVGAEEVRASDRKTAPRRAG